MKNRLFFTQKNNNNRILDILVKYILKKSPNSLNIFLKICNTVFSTSSDGKTVNQSRFTHIPKIVNKNKYNSKIKWNKNHHQFCNVIAEMYSINTIDEWNSDYELK